MRLKLQELEPKETRRRKKKLVQENKIQSQLDLSLHEELLVLSNDLDTNILGGESSKFGCNVLEFYYSSIYDAIHRHRSTRQVLILILTHEYHRFGSR